MGKENNLKDYLKDLYLGIASKKANASKNPQDFRSEIESIKIGQDTSDANAKAGDIIQGKTAYVNGSKITGTIPVRTGEDLSANGAIVTAPSGYYAGQVTKSVATATQATPSISVSTSGLITASSEQTAGYVANGTKTATEQLPTKSAQVHTPTTSDQIIERGSYLTGDQTIKGDLNLVASNIKKDVSIFGVVGTYEDSGGSGTLLRTVTCSLSIGSAPSDSFSTLEYTGPNGPALYDFKESAYVELTVVAGSVLSISFSDSMLGIGAEGDSSIQYAFAWNVGMTRCTLTVPPENFIVYGTY